jgi:hypothetical protein
MRRSPGKGYASVLGLFGEHSCDKVTKSPGNHAILCQPNWHKSRSLKMPSKFLLTLIEHPNRHSPPRGYADRSVADRKMSERTTRGTTSAPTHGR